MPRLVTDEQRDNKRATAKARYQRDKMAILERAHQHYQMRREQVDAIKMARGCADCGYREYPCALDFDHRDGEVKLFNIGSAITNRKWELVLAEIDKCDVVCANCHRVRTYSCRDL